MSGRTERPGTDRPSGGRAPEPEVRMESNASGWKRPAAMARDSNLKAWLIFMAVLCLMVALWTPLRVLYYRQGYQEEGNRGPRDADAFVAVAYYGVNSERDSGSQDISTEEFTEQLKLLRERGYTPLSLRDVRAFYEEGRPLPRKAILMTFEQSRKSTYFEVRNLLRQYRWRGVMGVATAPMHKRDAQALLWPYLRDMLAMESWELAAQSEAGFDPIPANPSGVTGAFFATPQWLAGKGRYELPEEFNQRVAGDHDKVIEEFEREGSAKPLAFFFPYGDYGQYDESARVVRMANLRQVEKNYALGFTLGQLALNTRSSDPRRLNRLLVRPEWSPLEFIDRLEMFWPITVAHDHGKMGVAPERWVREWGELQQDGIEVTLRAVPPRNPLLTPQQSPGDATTGAKAWLAGSDNFEDGFVSLRFSLKRGRFGVYLRATSVGEYIYFGLDNTGKAFLRQKLRDVDELLLASDTASGDPRTNHELLLCLRGNLAFCRLDGEQLFGGGVLLRGEPHAGMIGCGVWDPLPGMAKATIFDARIAAHRDTLVSWQPEISKDIAYLTKWLNQHGYQFNVLAPPWLDVYENAPVTFPVWDRQALSLLARTNQMKIMPRIQIRDVALLLKVPAEEIAERAHDYGAQGLFVDTTACHPDQAAMMVSWLVKLREQMAPRDMQLALRMPTAIEHLASSGNILKLLPDVLLVGDFEEPPYGLPQERVMGLVHVTPPASDETLTLYYQLSDMLSIHNDLSSDAKKEELRHKGFDAFTAGDYQEAVKQWEAWQECDPRNAEPDALIGDAWLRLNQPEKASESYTRSLAINPGQMELAIRHARLLERMERKLESAEMLNIYARAFPDNPTIIIAQAQWLQRQRRHSEARDLVRDLITRFPDNIEARLILQSLLDERRERYENIHQLLDIGRGSDSYLFGFGRDIFAAELLTIPEATVFFDFIRRSAADAPGRKSRELYQSFLPLANKISENFVFDKLSDNWIAFGGLQPSVRGRYELRAGSDMSEAFLRLKRSELMRDGFIEVSLDESVGSFWLYARRSSKALVRFGYDDEGFIRIQSWQDGELRNSDSRPWLRPPGTIQLRLEVHGDGAAGYVNGEPSFLTPLLIPQDICYGWWSLAPFAPELGQARVRIDKIECGPLRPAILLLPQLSDTETRTALRVMRTPARYLSALSPMAFEQLADGTLTHQPKSDLSMLKMFATFHRLRLLPVVNLGFFSEADPKELGQIITTNGLAGIVVRVRTMPKRKWFEEMEKLLEELPASVLVLQQEEWPWPQALERIATNDSQDELPEGARSVTVREIERGNLLLQPVKTSWQTQARLFDPWRTKLAENQGLGIEPNVVVMPRDTLRDTKADTETRPQ